MFHFLRLGLVLVFVLLWTTTAGAEEKTPPPKVECACAAEPLAQQFDNAHAVVVATVKDIQKVKKYDKPVITDPAVEVTLDIEEEFKDDFDEAEAGKPFILHTNITFKTCCGHPFVIGEKYILFAYRREDYKHKPWSLYVFESGTYDVGGLCGGTVLFSAAGEILPKIRALAKKEAARSRIPFK